jgi:hypothetical protein
MLFLRHLLLLPSIAFGLPVLWGFIHIFHPKFKLKTLHLDGNAHNFLHLLLGEFFLLDLELVQAIVVGREVHELIIDGMGGILC